MLQKMRQQSRSTIVIMLFGFIIFVFVFSFGSGSDGFKSGGCGRAGEAVRVNEESIGEMNFKYHYDLMLRSRLNRLPNNKSLKQEDRAFLREQTMHQLVDHALLRQAARRVGLHVTDQERNQDIRNTPIFHDSNNHFSFQLYKAIVERNFGTTLKMFEQLWRDNMLANHMREIIQDTTRISEDELEYVFINKNTKIELGFLKVSSSAFAQGLSVSEKEIDQLTKDHADQIEAYYRMRNDKYHKPKKVRVAHILFKVGQGYDAEQLADKKEQTQFTLEDLQKDADFSEQAKRYSEDYDTRDKGGELVFMTQEALTAKWGAPFAEEAFKLTKNGLSEIVKSDQGFHIIKVTDIIEAEHHPLDEVKTALAKEIIIKERSQQLAKEKANGLLESLRKGKKIDDLAPASPDDKTKPAQPNQKLQSGSTGLFARMGGYLPQIGSNQEMATLAFALIKEKPLPDRVFEIQSGEDVPTYVVLSLKNRVDADMSAFAAAKKDLSKQVLRSRRMLQLQAWLQRERNESIIDVNPAFMNELTQVGYRKQPQ